MDEKTVAVHLTEGNSEFLANLTLAVIPKANEDPAGILSGPVLLSMYPIRRDKISPWQKMKTIGRKARLIWMRFSLNLLRTTDTAFTQLQAGTIDIMNYLTHRPGPDPFQSGSQFEIVEGNMNLVHAMFLIMNMNLFPMCVCARLYAMLWTGMLSTVSFLTEKATLSVPI